MKHNLMAFENKNDKTCEFVSDNIEQNSDNIHDIHSIILRTKEVVPSRKLITQWDTWHTCKSHIATCRETEVRKNKQVIF